MHLKMDAVEPWKKLYHYEVMGVPIKVKGSQTKMGVCKGKHQQNTSEMPVKHLQHRPSFHVKHHYCFQINFISIVSPTKYIILSFVDVWWVLWILTKLLQLSLHHYIITSLSFQVIFHFSHFILLCPVFLSGNTSGSRIFQLEMLDL